MNIFYLDKDIQKCAEYHCDKHICKQIVECAQILSTTSREYGLLQGYKSTHKNHPCTKWAMISKENWVWLRDLAMALCEEYTYRYGKIHKTESVISNLKCPPIPSIIWGEPPKCMPDEYKKDSTIESYRNYYRQGKAHLCKWTKRNKPYWMDISLGQPQYVGRMAPPKEVEVIPSKEPVGFEFRQIEGIRRLGDGIYQLMAFEIIKPEDKK